MRTEGNLTVVHLKSCGGPILDSSRDTPLIPIHPRSRLLRYFRTQVLLYKSDVIRGNLVYSAFDLTRMSVRALRHRHGVAVDDDYNDLPMSPVSPDTLFPQITFGD
jgi:hypothetical protein